MKAWVISVDMGYGHQRAAYPFKDIANEKIITANSDKTLSEHEKAVWMRLQTVYEGLSRLQKIPVIGAYIWRLYDRMQRISPFYPFRDLSAPNIGTLYAARLIKKGFLQSLIDYIKRKEIPMITTFFAPSLAASHHRMKKAFCILTDTDVNRIWVPRDPSKDTVNYLAPTEQCAKRLMQYGVAKSRIFFTGFPLPKENLGRRLEILKKDLGSRLANLDPNKRWLKEYEPLVRFKLKKNYRKKSSHPLTLLYAVGGAGAQTELGEKIVVSLRRKIKRHEIRLLLSAGTRPEVSEFFRGIIMHYGLEQELGKYVDIIFNLDKKGYFAAFNNALHTTDIIWSKPSELSFYVALGLPMIIAPPIGYHEILNKQWLIRMGTGIEQENPSYVNEWLFDWLNKGFLAESAWEGFIEAPKYGTYNIEKLVFAKDRSKVKLQY